VLPSLNSTEAFGLVQIEAMMNQIPVVASDLPGVRQPVMRHKMGKIIPIGDDLALAEAMIEVLRNRKEYLKDPRTIAEQYVPDAVARAYERLFSSLLTELQGK